MEELKMQNSLLLQLVSGLQRQINSKNRQNQILFQQYEQLAADNRLIQQQADSLRTHNNELKRQTTSLNTQHATHRQSPFELEIAQHKKRHIELQHCIDELKVQLEQRGGRVILLQEQLQMAKFAAGNAEDSSKAIEEAQSAKEMLGLKEQVVNELTEYMQTQSNKIEQLTRAGIIAIDNYEDKILKKDTLIYSLNQQIAQLKQRIALLTNEKEAQKESSVNAEKLKELQTIILSKEQSIAELSQFLQKQSDKVNRLQQNISQSNQQSLKTEIQKFKQIVESKQQSIVQLSDFLNILSSKNKGIQQQLQRIQEEKSLEQILGDNNSDIVANLESKIQKLKQFIGIQQQEIAQMMNKPQQNESLLKEIDMLRTRLSTKEDDTSVLISKLQEKQAEITVLRVQLDEKIVKITMLEAISQQNDAQFPSDNNQTKQDAPQAIVQSYESERPDYQTLLLLKNNQIQTIKATIQQKDQSLRDFTQFISQQTSRIDNLEKYIEVSQAIIKTKEQAIEQLRTFLEESYAKNAQIGSQLKHAQQNVAKMQLLIDQFKKIDNQNVNESEKIEILLPSSGQIQLLASSQQQQNQIEQKINEEQGLRSQIAELQMTLKSKYENINQLADFMSQQAEQIQELKSKSNQDNGAAKSHRGQSHLLQKVSDLQVIIKSKEAQHAEINKFLQQAQNKIGILQEQKRILTLSEADLLKRVTQQQQAFRQLQKDKQQISFTMYVAITQTAIKEEKYQRIISKLQEQLSQRLQKIEKANMGKDIQSLKETIKELQETIKTKDENFAQLSDFMSQQSLQIQQLEEKLNKQAEGSQNVNHDIIEELQAVIKSKEVSITELTQFLEEVYAKNAELQQLIKLNPIQVQQDQVDHQTIQVQSATVKEKQALLQDINGQIGQKITKLAQMTTLHQVITKQTAQQQQNLSSLKGEIEQAKQNYNAQVDEFNQHRGTMENEMQGIAHALQEQVHHMEELQKNIVKLQQQANQLRSQIKALQQQKNVSSPRFQTQITQQITNDRGLIAQMQAQITQYEGFLNDRQKEMASMMQVMENLQSEISNKNQLINHFQQSSYQAIQYKRIQIDQEMMQQSNKMKQKYEQELNDMKQEQADLQKQLNLQGKFDNGEIENNEQLTVLQAIQQILVYSQGQIDIESIMRMIQVLKRSYLRQNQCILKQNSELKDSLNSLVDVNSNVVAEMQNLKALVHELRQLIQEKEQLLDQARQRESEMQNNYQSQIKQLRKSINGSGDQSPTIVKNTREQDLNTINKLEDQIISLRQQNQQKDVQLTQLKTNSNKNFVNELNNLLDSCTVAKEGEQMKQMEEQLEKITLQRDQIASKCKEYEIQIANLQRQSQYLTIQLQNNTKNIAQNAHIHNSQGHDSLQTVEVLAGLQAPARQSQIHVSDLEEQQPQKWRNQNEQLHMLLQEKDAAISQLQETMLNLEKGYNSEIMNLRKNIAWLKNEAITLRKSLYQANPDGFDIAELIKDTFSHQERDTEFFRPPSYTHSIIPPAQKLNNSYYSDAQQVPRSPSSYQRYFETSTELNLGQRFMGRRCRQASPFNYGQASRMTAWEHQFHNRY